jgi:predicted enzyme related to lactoylglutathione lyase/uncharacterized glyoxalase superfamily protein PhnB
MPPTLADGKLCYVEIPAADVARSAAFYAAVFGWRIRERGDGTTAFDDTVGEVSGAWVTGRPPAAEPGLLLYVMCESVAATVEAVVAHGGALVQAIGVDAPEVTARIADPAGNVIGLYQEPGGLPAVPAATLAPQLAVRRGRAAVEFYTAAFGAVEEYRVGGTDAEEAVVAQLSVGGATFWVADEAPEHGTFSPETAGGATVRMLLVVAEPEAVVARAVAAGAMALSPVGDEHGWRLGRIADPFGHHWEIGRPLGPWPPARHG